MSFINNYLSNLSLAQADIASTLANPTIIIVAVVAMAIAGFIYLQQGKALPTGGLADKVQNLQGQVGDVGNIALEKVDDVLDEYQQILPYLAELGIKVNGLDIEVGFLPKLKTSLVASIETIQVEAVEKVKQENTGNVLLISILDGVLFAKRCHARLDDASISLFKDVVIDVTLGIPPAISVSFK